MIANIGVGDVSVARLVANMAKRRQSCLQDACDILDSLKTIRVVAVFINILAPGCQTNHTPFVSMNQPYLEALVMARGILLHVRAG